MKKLLSLLLLLTSALAGNAYDFPYLVFQHADGTTTTVKTTSLVITFSDGKLTATNENGSQTLTLSDLLSMQFSERADATGIRENSVIKEEGIEVFTLGGRLLGKYDNAEQAKASLRPGLYLMKSNNKTSKITVK